MPKELVGSARACIAGGNDQSWCEHRCKDIAIDSIVRGDSLSLFKCIPTGSIDAIFADEPYGIAATSSPGLGWKAKRWKTINKDDQPWDDMNAEHLDAFHAAWVPEAFRVLKPGGTMWTTGTYHNIYRLGKQIADTGFKILNDISWYKPDGFPNVTRRNFSASHETLIWAKKPGAPHVFNYNVMKHGDFPEDKLKKPGKQMRSVWSIPKVSRESIGYPAQKPTKLLERIVLSSTNPGDVILDPFSGSGTAAAVAKQTCRHYIAIDIDGGAIRKSTARLDGIPACRASRDPARPL